MTVLLITTVLFILWLLFERIGHERNLRSIPLRIAVTGTRGKSSVVRLLAAVLREDGRTVLAKTTGSRAEVILPDGAGEEVPRRGVPSIIEQVRSVRQAARLGVDVLVMETMSIHAENHRVEGEVLVQPHLVAVTNARPDHVEAMGYPGRSRGLPVCRRRERGLPVERRLLKSGEGRVGRNVRGGGGAATGNVR